MLDLSPLEDMKTWADGWNGYDALAPNHQAVERAKAFLHEVSTHDPIIPQPLFITGNAWGDVVLEWVEDGDRLYAACICPLACDDSYFYGGEETSSLLHSDDRLLFLTWLSTPFPS